MAEVVKMQIECRVVEVLSSLDPADLSSLECRCCCLFESTGSVTV